MSEEYVPTLSEIWEVLIGLKEATESGFGRVEHRLDGVEHRLDRVECRLGGVERRLDGLEDRFTRLDDRFSDFQKGTTRLLSDHERRLTRVDRRRS